jgi:DNA modification methylase
MSVIVLRGDARRLPLADASVDLIVTSPPYYALRSYTDTPQLCVRCKQLPDGYVNPGDALRNLREAWPDWDAHVAAEHSPKHYDGQIGAEKTPAEYVDNLIDCTREWMRVLKPSGSIFVNLGDSYSRGQPFDSTLTVADAAWLAGMVDSDGCITVRHTQQPTMRAPTFEGVIAIEQEDQDGVRRAHAITGQGRVWSIKGGRGKPMWRWSVSTRQARWVAERIWPFLRIKQRQALAIVELARHREEHSARGRYNPIKPEWIEYRQRICRAVRAWNQRERDDWEPPLLPVVDLPLRPRMVQPKSLTGLPWRYALRCIDELGLILRAEVIWDKPNGLPESVTDRVRRSHEQWFHMTRAPRYYSAVDRIRQPHAPATAARYAAGYGNRTKANGARKSTGYDLGGDDWKANPLGALPGSVWEIPTQPLKVPAHLGIDHFAAFPMEWPRRIVQGWSPEGICTGCGEGRRPVADRCAEQADSSVRGARDRVAATGGRISGGTLQSTLRGLTVRTVTGEVCACPDTSAPTRPAVVVDPCGGTGTTALVAHALGRIGISVDMSMDYARLAQWRTTDPGQLAAALEVDKPAKQVDDQLDLFEGVPP